MISICVFGINYRLSTISAESTQITSNEGFYTICDTSELVDSKGHYAKYKIANKIGTFIKD